MGRDEQNSSRPSTVVQTQLVTTHGKYVGIRITLIREIGKTICRRSMRESEIEKERCREIESRIAREVGRLRLIE